VSFHILAKIHEAIYGHSKIPVVITSAVKSCLLRQVGREPEACNPVYLGTVIGRFAVGGQPGQIVCQTPLPK
jgi:hypothetical protein